MVPKDDDASKETVVVFFAQICINPIKNVSTNNARTRCPNRRFAAMFDVSGMCGEDRTLNH